VSQRGIIPGGHRPEFWVTPGLAGTDLWREECFEVEKFVIHRWFRLVVGLRVFNGEGATAPRGVRLVRGEMPRRENLKSVPGMKQGRVGLRGCKPSGGWETLEAGRSGESGNAPC
jgi:hypothetical protein